MLCERIVRGPPFTSKRAPAKISKQSRGHRYITNGNKE